MPDQQRNGLPQDALIVLGAAGDHIPVYQEARRRGVPTIAVDWREDSPARPFADAFLEISTRDSDAIAAALGDTRPAGIVAGATDVALPTWHALGQRYRTRYLYPSSALAASDKAAFHEIAESAGVVGYGFAASDDPDKVVTEAAALRFPLVVKPADGSGSKGVVHVAHSEELPAAVAYARAFAASGNVIAEEFIHGRPLAVETFMRDGRSLFTDIEDKEFVPGTFVISRMRCPARLPAMTRALLEATAERLCRALGVADGPANFDVVLSADGRPYVIEANPRIGGDGVPRLVAAAYGIDTVRALVSLALGEPFDLAPTWAAHAALEIIGSPSDTDGELVTIEGAAEARAVPGITDLDLYARPGDLVQPHDQAGHKIGVLVAADQSAEAADASLARARALLRPVIRPTTRHTPVQTGS